MDEGLDAVLSARVRSRSRQAHERCHRGGGQGRSRGGAGSGGRRVRAARRLGVLARPEVVDRRARAARLGDCGAVRREARPRHGNAPLAGRRILPPHDRAPRGLRGQVRRAKVRRRDVAPRGVPERREGRRLGLRLHVVRGRHLREAQVRREERAARQGRHDEAPQPLVPWRGIVSRCRACRRRCRRPRDMGVGQDHDSRDNAGARESARRIPYASEREPDCQRVRGRASRPLGCDEPEAL